MLKPCFMATGDKRGYCRVIVDEEYLNVFLSKEHFFETANEAIAASTGMPDSDGGPGDDETSDETDIIRAALGVEGTAYVDNGDFGSGKPGSYEWAEIHLKQCKTKKDISDFFQEAVGEVLTLKRSKNDTLKEALKRLKELNYGDS